MKSRCVACNHPKSQEISEDLISGVSIRSVAEKYNISRGTVQGHKKNCIPKIVDEAMAKAKEAKKQLITAGEDNDLLHAQTLIAENQRIMDGISLAKKIGDVLDDADTIRKNAINKKDDAAILNAGARILKAVETYGKLRESLKDQERSDGDRIKKEWLEIKEILMKVFAKFPEAEEMFVNELDRKRASVLDT